MKWYTATILGHVKECISKTTILSESTRYFYEYFMQMFKGEGMIFVHA